MSDSLENIYVPRKWKQAKFHSTYVKQKIEKIVEMAAATDLLNSIASQTVSL